MKVTLILFWLMGEMGHSAGFGIFPSTKNARQLNLFVWGQRLPGGAFEVQT